MEETPRHTLGSQTQHTYSLEDNTRISQQKTNTTQKQHHNFQRENIHHTHTDSKRIQQTIHQQFKHKTHKTNRHIDRKTLKLQTTNIALTTIQVEAAIKQRKNNNSTTCTLHTRPSSIQHTT